MPNIKSAKKRMRTSAEKRLRNRAVRSKIGSIGRTVRESVAGGDAAKSGRCLREYFSVLDKAVKKGIITRNTADRRKSRAAKRLARLPALPAPHGVGQAGRPA